VRSDAEQTMQQINVTEFGVRREELESRFQELIRKYETLFHIFAFFKLSLHYMSRQSPRDAKVRSQIENEKIGKSNRNF